MKAILSISLLIALNSMLLGACGSSATLKTQTNVPASAPTMPPTAPAPSLVSAIVLTLHSEAFEAGDEIPLKYTFTNGEQCNGDNYSPPLSWEGIPSGTQSFVITIVDPDGGNWTHWVQFNLPAETTDLPETIDGPLVGLKGKNSFNRLGYGGPCPPSGKHHYVFTLYALDTTLTLEEGATLTMVTKAMQDHILAKAELIGLRSR